MTKDSSVKYNTHKWSCFWRKKYWHIVNYISQFQFLTRRLFYNTYACLNGRVLDFSRLKLQKRPEIEEKSCSNMIWSLNKHFLYFPSSFSIIWNVTLSTIRILHVFKSWGCFFVYIYIYIYIYLFIYLFIFLVNPF